MIEYLSPTRFAQIRQLALEAGLRWVLAGPFVRSSYHAIDAVQPAMEDVAAPAR